MCFVKPVFVLVIDENDYEYKNQNTENSKMKINVRHARDSKDWCRNQGAGFYP